MTGLYILIGIIGGILNAILFWKVWNMCDNVAKITKKLCENSENTNVTKTICESSTATETSDQITEKNSTEISPETNDQITEKNSTEISPETNGTIWIVPGIIVAIIIIGGILCSLIYLMAMMVLH